MSTSALLFFCTLGTAIVVAIFRFFHQTQKQKNHACNHDELITFKTKDLLDWADTVTQEDGTQENKK